MPRKSRMLNTEVFKHMSKMASIPVGDNAFALSGNTAADSKVIWYNIYETPADVVNATFTVKNYVVSGTLIRANFFFSELPADTKYVHITAYLVKLASRVVSNTYLEAMLQNFSPNINSPDKHMLETFEDRENLLGITTKVITTSGFSDQAIPAGTISMQLNRYTFHMANENLVLLFRMRAFGSAVNTGIEAITMPVETSQGFIALDIVSKVLD